MRVLTALWQWVARVRACAGTRELDRDFDQEFESHLAMSIDDHVRRGMTPEEARRAALIRMGGPSSLREQHRAARGLPTLEAVLQDLRFAVRLMGRERWFSAAVIATLALGIGVNAVGFTIVNAGFLRLGGVHRWPDEHQRRPDHAGIDAGHVADGQCLRRAQATAAVRP